jgi:quinoprotein glucose dehydrogenase
MRTFLLPALLFSATSLAAQHAADPAAFAAAGEQAAKLQLAPGFQLKVWATEPQLSNGVAFHFDPRGRVHVAESHRWNRSIFDITQKTNWLLNDLAFQSVAERVAFLEAQFDAIDPELLTRDSEIVRRIEDRDGDGQADHSEVLADGFNSAADGTAAGVLGTRDAVYFANIPHLWKLEPKADGSVQRTSLASGFGVHVGVSGHDLHGLIFGPDGRLYMSFGDRGASITNREGRVIHLPDMGAVLRCEPDGRNLEVFCIGLRNPQELAFDDDGNLWTVDNDTAGADPCRVLHLVQDGDYGWRASYQHMAGFGPWVQEELWKGGQDNILPIAGTVSQGPSGLAFYPGTGFGGKLRGTFLHADFPGGVWSYTVRPRGASFEVATKEKFLWNCWPTDVDFGPDGAAYVLDWVAGWGQPLKGRIYRITPDQPLASAEAETVAEVKRLLARGLAQESTLNLVTLLRHPDRRIRLEAQFEFARRGPSSLPTLASTASTGPTSLARRHALWAISQILRTAPRTVTLSSVQGLVRLVDDPDDAVAAVAARVLAEAGVREIVPALVQRTLSGSDLIRFHAAMALGDLAPLLEQPESASDAAAALLGANASRDPFLTHAAIRVWTRLGSSGTDPAPHPQLALRLADPNPEIRLGATLALRHLRLPTITNQLSDADPRVVIAAARAIHDAPVAAGLPALASLLGRVDCPPSIQTRAIDAAFRLGTQQHALILAAFAKRRDPAPAARAAALLALGNWPQPPPLDPINGLWRPPVILGRAAAVPEPASVPNPNPLLERAAAAAGSRATALPILPDDLGRSASFEEAMALKRNAEPARRAFLRVADEILNPSTPDEYGVVVPGGPAPLEVQLALVQTASLLRTKEAAQPLFEEFARTNTPPALRRAIVPLLAHLNAIQAADAVRLALADPDPALRAVAIPHLDRLDPGSALPLLTGLVQPGSPNPTAQAGYKALALLAQPESDALLSNALGQLLEGKLVPELHLDVLQAAELRQKDNPTLRSGLDQWIASIPAGDPIGQRRPTLRGGDRSRGASIFRNHPQVQCLRCHQVAGDGGTVGPALDGISKTRDRAYLLESIVHPNKEFAEGYKPADGGLSAMPEGLADLLSPFEMRDLIEFLASLR